MIKKSIISAILLGSIFLILSKIKNDEQKILDYSSTNNISEEEKVLSTPPQLNLPISAPEGWYFHRINNGTLLLTKDKEFKPGGTELYALGTFLTFDVLSTNKTPEEMVKTSKNSEPPPLEISLEKMGQFDYIKQLSDASESSGVVLYHRIFVGNNKVYTFSAYPYSIDNKELIDVLGALEKSVLDLIKKGSYPF